MLLMHHAWFTKETLLTQMDQEIEQHVVDLILHDYKRYVNDKEPLEYIMGYVEFDQRKLFVDKNTMIPRPETEYMIQACKQELQEWAQTSTEWQHIVADVGTGCGVLGLSTFLSAPDWCDSLFLMDYYPECLKTAKKNAHHLLTQEQQQKAHYLHANLLQGLLEKVSLEENDSLLVTANLPYIPTQTFDEQAEDNVHLWEPRYAFISGDDGLDLYREMFAQIKEHDWLRAMATGGRFVMFLEMMTWQVDILRKEFPWMSFEEVKTFHFQIRIVKATFQ